MWAWAQGVQSSPTDLEEMKCSPGAVEEKPESVAALIWAGKLATAVVPIISVTVRVER